MKRQIEAVINETIINSKFEIYREPLIGYANANDPIFKQLKKAVGPEHLLPQDLLAGAQSVLAFFLPFKKEVIVNNRNCTLASREWAEVYIRTNRLIDQIIINLKVYLAKQGVCLESQPPTYFFDPVKLIAAWSHKHVAYACGLGTFGRNHLLITPKGCGGRFGTAVLNIPLEPSHRPEAISYCNSQINGCNYCQVICPVNALASIDFERKLCYQQCQLNDRSYEDLESCEVCGKCATGPCAYVE
jgi:epoxyqueuosine reductase QueG